MKLLRLSAAAVALVLSVGCSVELQHDLTEDDANQITVLLLENGISPTKSRDEGGNEPRYTVSVPKSDFKTSARLLSDYALPRPKAPGLESFRKNKGMIPTQTEEKAMFLEAMAGEVDKALNKIDGVLEAKTIVMVPENNDLTQPENKPKNTAAVLVRYRNVGENKAPMSSDEIKLFVANSLPEMDPKNVAVILHEALPPQAMANEESQLTDVLGIRMTKASASTFKFVAVAVVLLIVLIGAFAAYFMVRGGGAAQAQKARARARPEA